MSRHRRLLLPAVLAVAAALAIGRTFTIHGSAAANTTLAAAAALHGGAGAAGFARADAPRAFSFPADHGPHPEYRNEWWYFTGNLRTAAGRQFGYQLTVFRIGLAAARPASSSAWRTGQIYMAHLAVSDIEARRFHAFERFSRDALGLAGAQAAPLRVWVEDWTVEGDASPALRLHLKAADAPIAIDLTLHQNKPIVLPGERGLSRKSDAPGNASYYYSVTRLSTRGRLSIDGSDYEVSGNSWMDREWGTSMLDAGEIGWDWFALQLDDGRDVMFYRLRRRDGSADPHSAGVVVMPDGATRTLAAADVGIETLSRWRSPRGADYPGRWRLRIAPEDIDVTVEPLLADQELDLSVRYWEGAVALHGKSHGREGTGYVELTGYADTGDDPHYP